MSKRARNFFLVAVLVLAALTLSSCVAPNASMTNPQGPWETFVVVPLAKALVFLNDVISGAGLGFSWGWAIILFTIIIKLVTLPLTLKQLQSTKATQELQPKLQELQQKYGKDRQKLAEEQMKLYKEAGVNPMGGCLPLLIQMPVLFGLYQALYLLANSGMLEKARFFWIPDLSFPNLKVGMGWIAQSFNSRNYYELFAYLSLPVLMILSQLVLQKMTQPAAAPAGQKKNDQTQMMGQMMMFMPIMFGYITLGLPSGLTLYWSVSNLLSVVQQYFITGWGDLGSWIPILRPKGAALSQPEGVSGGSTLPGPTAPPADRPKRRRRRK